MELLSFCAISIGGFLSILVLVRLASFLTESADVVSLFISKHLIYPYLVDRHRICGPWSRANLLLCFAYAALHVFFISFRTTNAEIAGYRAGTLAVINLALLIPTTHLSFLADIIGVSLVACRRMHRVVGWMSGMLLAFHITLAMTIGQREWNLNNQSNLFALFVSFTPHKHADKS
jgi:hypothetical protein